MSHQHPATQYLDDYSTLKPEVAAAARRVDAIHVQQQNLLNKNQSLLSAADNEGRRLSDEERHTIRRRSAQVEELEDEASGLIAEMNKPLPRRTPADAALPLGQELGGRWREASSGTMTGMQAALEVYRTRGSDGGAHFPTLGAFARAVAQRHPSLFAAATIQTTVGDGPSAGFLVPTDLSLALMQLTLSQEAVRPYATVLPMPHGSLNLPRFAARNRSGGDVAGVMANAVGEGVDLPLSKPKVETLTLVARKLAATVAVTRELVDDAGPAFSRLLMQNMAAAISAAVDDALLMGTGSGQALGILNSPALVTVAKESGQANGTLVPENLAKMLSRLDPASHARGRWLMHPSVAVQLHLLQLKVKNAAANDFVGGSALPWYQIGPDGKATLLGLPVTTTDRLPPLGSKGDIILIDPTSYVIGVTHELRLEASDQALFGSDEILFRATCRLDGAPIPAGPTTPRRGSDTLSPFVTLAERS